MLYVTRYTLYVIRLVLDVSCLVFGVWLNISLAFKNKDLYNDYNYKFFKIICLTH